MKRVLGSLLVLAALAGPAQAAKVSSINGFQDTRWGDSVATTKAKLGKKFKPNGFADDGTPMFVGDFGGFRHCDVYTWFKTGKLYRVRVTLAAQDGKNTKDIFFEALAKLQKVYGLPSSFAIKYYSQDKVIAPSDLREMTEDDAKQIEADIMAARAYGVCRWDFKSDTGVVIQSMREQEQEGSNLFVAIDYYSAAMEKKAEDSALKDF